MSDSRREGVEHYIDLSVRFALTDGERGHDDGVYLNARIAANYGFQLLPELREPRTWKAPDAMQFRGSIGQNLRCEHGIWSGWRCWMCKGRPAELLRLLGAMTPPKPRTGFGPFREDYATQESFDKTRGSRVAIEDKP